MDSQEEAAKTLDPHFTIVTKQFWPRLLQNAALTASHEHDLKSMNCSSPKKGQIFCAKFNIYCSMQGIVNDSYMQVCLQSEENCPSIDFQNWDF